MQFADENDIPGVLLMIDFEKAFDSVSWDFIDKTLQLFNFGESFRKFRISQILQSVRMASSHLSSFTSRLQARGSHFFLLISIMC